MQHVLTLCASADVSSVEPSNAAPNCDSPCSRHGDQRSHTAVRTLLGETLTPIWLTSAPMPRRNPTARVKVASRGMKQASEHNTNVCLSSYLAIHPRRWTDYGDELNCVTRVSPASLFVALHFDATKHHKMVPICAANPLSCICTRDAMRLAELASRRTTRVMQGARAASMDAACASCPGGLTTSRCCPS